MREKRAHDSYGCSDQSPRPSIPGVVHPPTTSPLSNRHSYNQEPQPYESGVFLASYRYLSDADQGTNAAHDVAVRRGSCCVEVR